MKALQASTCAIVTVEENPVTFADFVEMWLSAIGDEDKTNRPRKERTIQNYRYSMLSVFKPWLDSAGISAPTKEDIRAFCNWMNAHPQKRNPAEKWTPATKNAYLSAVKSFYKWLEKNYDVTNVAAGFESYKVSQGSSRGYITGAEMRKLMSTIDEVTKTRAEKLLKAGKKTAAKTAKLRGLRDRAIISVILSGGLRAIEISRLCVRDIFFSGEAVMLRVIGKGKTEAETSDVKIGRGAYEEIQRWLTAREAVELVSDDSPIFSNLGYVGHGTAITPHQISVLCREYLLAANLAGGNMNDRSKDATEPQQREADKANTKRKESRKPNSCHSLRASCATLAYRMGAKLEEVSKQLRHKNLQTTDRYLRDYKNE